MSNLTPTYSTRIDADHRAVSSLRGEIADWLSHGGAEPACLGDLELVLTELMANVVDHTESPWVDVHVTFDADHIVMTVAGFGAVDAIPPTERWGEIRSGDRGHGLRIVQAICSSIELRGDGRRSAVRCSIPMA